MKYLAMGLLGEKKHYPLLRTPNQSELQLNFREFSALIFRITNVCVILTFLLVCLILIFVLVMSGRTLNKNAIVVEIQDKNEL